MKTTVIERKVTFHMGHRVPNHKSKCRNLHGHTYTVIIGVDGDIIKEEGVSDEGMVIDFGDLKEILQDEIYDFLDHSFMVYNKDYLFEIFKKEVFFNEMKLIIVDFVPTAENIARWLYNKLKDKINSKQRMLKYVTVWETQNSSATFYNDNEDVWSDEK